MKVAILHCHFLRGGVTQVVENQVASLIDDADTQFCLISGGRNDGLSDQTRQRVSEIVVPAIDYDDVRARAASDAEKSSEAIAAEIAFALQSKGWNAADTVLHWHNPTLGKNVAIPEVIRELTETHEFCQLLQIHDYAEDYRPENYLRIAQAALARLSLSTQSLSPEKVAAYCFPNAPSIHYATLTEADASVLRSLSVDDDRIEVIPNCVSLGGNSSSLDQDASKLKIHRAFGLGGDSRWIIYPVRGIRRKNVGEFVLLSQLLGDPFSLGVTLPPTTPIEKASYDRWKSVAKEHACRAIFDAGTADGIHFLDNLIASDFVLSTSVAEGFGMAFLEPWLAGRGVIARHLPNVVNDFAAAGIELDRFYDSIAIPGTSEWLNTQSTRYSNCHESAWESIESCLGRNFRVDCDALSFDEQTIDFAKLSTESQIEVISRCGSDLGFANEVRSLNADLMRAFQEPFEPSTIQSNQDSIEACYSLDATAQILRRRYQAVLASDAKLPTHPIHPSVSPLNTIQRSRDFYPCRTERKIAQCTTG